MTTPKSSHICMRCKETKPRSEFWKRGSNKIQNHCKPCSVARVKEYKRNHPDRSLKYCQKWATSNPEKVKRIILKNKYGISLERWKEMKMKQRNLCAICLKSSKKSLHVDHCHKTGKIRGLLCEGCNIGIGRLKDDPNVLRSAAAYLEKHLDDNQAITILPPMDKAS